MALSLMHTLRKWPFFPQALQVASYAGQFLRPPVCACLPQPLQDLEGADELFCCL